MGRLRRLLDRWWIRGLVIGVACGVGTGWMYGVDHFGVGSDWDAWLLSIWCGIPLGVLVHRLLPGERVS